MLERETRGHAEAEERPNGGQCSVLGQRESTTNTYQLCAMSPCGVWFWVRSSSSSSSPRGSLSSAAHRRSRSESCSGRKKKLKKSDADTKDDVRKGKDPDKELDIIHYKLKRLLLSMEDESEGAASNSDDECVVCVSGRCSVRTLPCGHCVVCQRCFVKTIQTAVDQRMLPLTCVICRGRILSLEHVMPSMTSPASTSTSAIRLTHRKHSFGDTFGFNSLARFQNPLPNHVKKPPSRRFGRPPSDSHHSDKPQPQPRPCPRKEPQSQHHQPPVKCDETTSRSLCECTEAIRGRPRPSEGAT